MLVPISCLGWWKRCSSEPGGYDTLSFELPRGYSSRSLTRRDVDTLRGASIYRPDCDTLSPVFTPSITSPSLLAATAQKNLSRADHSLRSKMVNIHTSQVIGADLPDTYMLTYQPHCSRPSSTSSRFSSSSFSSSAHAPTFTN